MSHTLPAPTPQEAIAKEASICSALADLGSARQAPLGARDYKAYVKTLLPLDLDEIRQACEQLAIEERPEGGTAFPSLGAIVATIKRRKAEKLRLEREAREAAEHEAIRARVQAERAEDLAAGASPTPVTDAVRDLIAQVEARRPARREEAVEENRAAFDKMKRVLGLTPEQIAEAGARMLGQKTGAR